MNHRSHHARSRGRTARSAIALTLAAAFGSAASVAHAQGQETKPPAAAPSAKPAPAPAAPAKPEDKSTTGKGDAKPAPSKGDAKPDTKTDAADAAAASDATAAPPATALPPPAAAEGRALPGTGTPGALPLWPEPSSDAAALEHQGEARPKPKTLDEVTERDHVYAEDWWAHARPILEMHGYLRVRAQLEHKFGLGRIDPRDKAMWPRPADDAYTDTSNLNGGINSGPTQTCTESESGVGPSSAASSAQYPCHANMQAGANMRFRINPELHISDNLRVMSQIDMLDNLVLGSTPSGYGNVPSSGGFAVAGRNGYAPLGFYDETEAPPTAGVNSTKNSIAVKRAWAEYSMPVGEIRFGRMPFQWGLGMMFNAGDGYDDDAQSTVDRIQIISGLKPLDLYFSAAWDFPNEGITSDSLALPNPEPYDLAQLDDVDQYVFSVMRRKAPQLERQSLTRGELVVNGGLQVVYRHQTLANDRTAANDTSTDGQCGAAGASAGAAALVCPISQSYQTGSFVRRDAHAWTPDLWLQVKFHKFRFEAEGATVQGSIANIDPTTNQSLIRGDPGYKIAAWGVATEMEQKLVEDKLSLQFKFGWSSGDPDIDGLAPVAGAPAQIGNDRTFSTFRFHPSYHVDMILGRSILTREQGTYYFRPSADYDFLRDPNGQRLGGGIAAIWTRASQFIQAPGHERDLGIELDGKIYFQSKDGALNDVPGILGGFYSEIDYGVLFPMAGLGYPDKLATEITNTLGASAADTKIAQTLRWYLGVMF